MKKDNITVVFSSHLSEEENLKFMNHISDTIGCKYGVHVYPNFNEFSLPQIYNQAMKDFPDEKTIFVFCHNDIEFKTKNWGKILINKFNHSKYGILGVAGTTFIPESGRWWDDRSKMYGIVEHQDQIKSWVSEYSNPFNGIKDVAHIDGLFMAVDPNKIKKEFNMDYGKFHFYDLTFCVDNYLADVYIGVTTDIRILHKSIGMTNQEWEDNRVKFVAEYSDILPLRDVTETSDKLRVLICCQFFGHYTGSEMSNYELSKELVKQGCDVTVIATNIGEPLFSKAKNAGVKVYHVSNAPNYRIAQDNQLQFIKTEAEFDIIHINHKPIGEQILKMYPNTPAVMHIRSEVIPVFEEPIINPQIKRYISIRESITQYVMGFGISGDKIVEIDNPFDYTRFNTEYKPIKNDIGVVLFVGTLDHLRKKILEDLVQVTYDNNQELWIIGDDSLNYASELNSAQHVKYLGVKSNVEDYVKKCDYTAGIFKGRTTIEGFLCGKPGWIYKVDKEGNIQSKEFTQVPEDVEKYRSDFSASRVFNLYEEVIEETWFK